MKRKKLGLFSIKEAFDNLPCGVAFFNHKGLPVLCNKRMQELSFEIYGKDLQSVFELEEGIESLSVKGQKDVFAVGNGVYRYERKQSRGEDGERTQIVIFDVTDLKEKQNQLLQRKKELQEIKAHLRELSKKIYDIVREEETLALKIKLHDDLGKGILLAKKRLTKTLRRRK